MARAVARLFALVLLAGCIGVGAPDQATLEAVRAGRQSIVMLRFVATDQDGQAVAPFAHAMLADDNLRLAFGGFATGGIPDDVYPLVRFPTREAREEGMVYVPLAPGFHYLAIQGARRTDVFADARRRRTAPLWRIEVPPGVQVLHAGTFRLTVKSETLLFGDIVITAIDHAATRVEDDADHAAAAAARDLPGLAPLATRLAVRHEGPILLGTPAR
jgi:hypothetical protein